MSNFDYQAHRNLSNDSQTSIEVAIEKAIEKSSRGTFVVCVTDAGDVLVLPEFSANVRNDISEVVFDTVNGYNFSTQKGS